MIDKTSIKFILVFLIILCISIFTFLATAVFQEQENTAGISPSFQE